MKQLALIVLITSTSLSSMQIEENRRTQENQAISLNQRIESLIYLTPQQKNYLTNPSVPFITRVLAHEEMRRQNAHPTQQDDN